MTDELLNYILKVEGEYLHRNSTEDDITTPGGVYRKAHGDAAIFSYIDTVASTLNIETPSSEWTKEEIDLVDQHLDKTMIKVMLSEFYDRYLYGAHLELFPKELQIMIFNLYTNSITGTWKSIQRTLIHLQKSNILDIPKEQLSTVDGQYGTKTKNALESLDFNKPLMTYVFKFETISNMRRYYADLVVSNPDKYLLYLKGWNNRLDNLY